MTKRMQLSDLQECFVNFETEKLEGCSVVYFNETLADGKSSETILNAYSYVVRSNSMPPAANPQSKHLWPSAMVATAYSVMAAEDAAVSMAYGNSKGWDPINWLAKMSMQVMAMAIYP